MTTKNLKFIKQIILILCNITYVYCCQRNLCSELCHENERFIFVHVLIYFNLGDNLNLNGLK